MTAREKFKELGYELVSESNMDCGNGFVIYRLVYNQGYAFIEFIHDKFTYEWGSYYDDLDRDQDPVTLDMEETKAVIMQLKELGWLDVEKD